MADLQAIAQAAQDAAQRAQTAAEAATAATGAAQSTAGERGITLPEEIIQKIADTSSATFIAALQAQGALRSTDPDPAPAPAPAPAEPPAEPAAKTFAERFLGIKLVQRS